MMSLPLDTVLLVPEKTDVEREEVVKTWQHLGGSIHRLGRFWEKPTGLEGKQIAIYGNDTFANVVAQVFGVQLVSPDDSLIARLSQQWTKRQISIKTLSELREVDFPRFVKPVIPKQFKAKVYQRLEELSAEAYGLDVQSQVLFSEIVEIKAEARVFVRGNQLMDVALYEGSADMEAGKAATTARFEQTYTTMLQHHNALEPHSLVSMWEGEKLTVYNATQGVSAYQKRLSELFGIPKENVRVMERAANEMRRLEST